MAIDIGDAILTVTLDQSQANAQLEQFGGTVPQKMGAAKAAIDDTTGAVSNMGKEFAVGYNGAKELGEITTLAGTQARESIYEARGEAALLGEMFGVHLPRHVRSFIAELPGVGVALSAAFQATAVLFIIEALAKLVEKIVDVVESTDKINKAWEAVKQSEEDAFNHLTDQLIKAQIQTDKLTGDHLGALLLELQLIDRTTLGNLRNEFTKLEKQADEAFTQMDTNFVSKMLGMEGSEAAKATFDQMAKAVNNALQANTPDSFLKALNAINAAAAEADARLKDMTTDPTQLRAWQELAERAEAYKNQLQQTAALDLQEKINSALELLKQQQTDLEQQAKRTMEARLEGIKSVENAEHIAFNDGKISADQWAQAQIKATDDAAKAHITYADSIAAITKKTEDTATAIKNGTLNIVEWTNAQSRATETSKSAAAAQDAHNERLKEWNTIAAKAAETLTKAQEETKKLTDEMNKIAFKPEQAKDQAKAFDQLEQAEKRLAEAQKTLAEAQSTQDFKQQEAAIKELANLRIVSKEQEAAMLARLNQQEETQGIAALQQLLSRQEDELNKAKAKFEAAAKDALFPPTELAQLKTKLDEAQAAWDKTQTEIIRRQTQSNSQRIALDRSYYGESVALAVAAGERELAEQLKETHAALLAAQAKLAEARSRGQNTTAIEQEIKRLQNLEKAQEKEAHQLVTAGSNLQRFLNLLRQGGGLSTVFERDMNSMSKSMQAFGATSQFVFDEFGSAMDNAIKQAILGEASLGQAMAKGTADVLAQIASRALVYGMFYTAQGIADVFWNPPRAAGDFAAAAEFFAIAAVAGGAAAGINAAAGGSGSSGGGGGASASGGSAASGPGLSAGAQPTNTVNVVHLGGGGLVAQPVIAAVGAASPAAAASASPSPSGGGGHAGSGVIHVHVEGMISPDNLHQVMRQMSRAVSTGRARLTSSVSIKNIRRS